MANACPPLIDNSGNYKKKTKQVKLNAEGKLVPNGAMYDVSSLN